MLKIGVLGAGHLGKIHINCIQLLEDTYELIGFYDPDPQIRKEVSQEKKIKSYGSIEELIEAVDVIDIVTPTLSHFDCAWLAIRNSKHVFIEKPITNTLAEAKKLINLKYEARVQVQVGHVERFNPAFRSALPYFNQPRFVEAHRLAQFNPRGTDVSVVLDLMIHDIDIVLSVMDSEVVKISASGVSVLSETPDIANARLEFANGSVANLTASRISLKNMRKSRFFQKDAYIAVDFLAKKTEIVRMKEVTGEVDPFALTIDMGESKNPKQILFDRPEIKETNAIRDELESFAEAISNNTEPIVTIDDGYKALDIAHQILKEMKKKADNLIW